MIALLLFLVGEEKENPDVRESSRRGLGPDILFLIVNATSPFFMQVGMYVGSTYALQYFLEPVVNLTHTQANRITHGRSTNNSLDDCSFSLAIRTRLLSR
jgi:hypothetical protein